MWKKLHFLTQNSNSPPEIRHVKLGASSQFPADKFQRPATKELVVMTTENTTIKYFVRMLGLFSGIFHLRRLLVHRFYITKVCFIYYIDKSRVFVFVWGKMAKLDTKNDLNRVGLFSELGYISIGDPYKRQSTSKKTIFSILICVISILSVIKGVSSAF